MGVHGLWELLAPVGRREPIETLYGKTVAIDISVWLTQFVRAMRDSEGAMLRNAHLLGIFRRCCKLLFHSIRPVFVFDGATPALKKKTLMLRAAARDRQEIKIRRLAEKLLRNRIKMDILEKSNRGRKKNNEDDREKENGVKMIASNSTGLSGKEMIDDFADAALAAAEKAKLNAENEQEPSKENEDEIQPRYEEVDEIQPRDSRETLDVVDEIQPRDPIAPVGKDSLKQQPNNGLPRNLTEQVHGNSSNPDPYANDFEPDDAVIDISEIPLDIDDETLAQVSSLPPSMHPELFRQLRQRQRLVNRQTILAHANKSNPLSFSEAQIKGFLQSTSLNQKIHSARSSFQTKGGSARRIASDHRRAYLLEELNEDGNDVRHAAVPKKGQRDSQRAPVISGIGWAERALQVKVPIVDGGRTGRGNGEQEESSDEDDMEWEQEVEINKENHPTLNLQNEVKSDLVPLVDDHRDVAIVDDEERSSKTQKGSTGESEMANLNNEETHILGTYEKEIPTNQEENNAEVNDMPSPEIIGNSMAARKTTESPEVTAVEPKSEMELAGAENSGRVADSSQDNNYERINEVTAASSPPKFAEQEAAVQHSKVDYESIRRGQKSEEPDVEDNAQTLSSSGPISQFAQEEKEGDQIEMATIEPALKKVVKFATDVVEIEKRKEVPISDAHAVQNPASSDPKTSPVVDNATESLPKMSAESTPVPQAILDTQAVIEELSDAEPPPALEKESRPSAAPRKTMTSADAEKLRAEIERENVELKSEQSARMKSTTSVSSEMFHETRELLNLFGIPFVEAPGEAEAQCAYLNSVDAVHAVVTEDSDAFLFGAKTVYKRLFSTSTSNSTSQGACEVYRIQQVAETLGIDKTGLIRLALLLGSDYTQGVRGVGIVNAMEIMHAFPGEKGLEEFAEWFRNQPVTAVLPPELKRLKRSNKKGKRRRKSEEGYISDMVSDEDTDDDGEEGDYRRNGDAEEKADEMKNGDDDEQTEKKETTVAEKKGDEMESDGKGDSNDTTSGVEKARVEKKIFEEKHKNVRRNWVVGNGFPSEMVIQAYEEPLIDKKVDKFEWQGVDYEGLGRFCWDKFGWTRDRFEQVIKDLKRSGTTKRRIPSIQRSSEERFARIRSERLRRAVGGLGGTAGLERLGEFAKEKEKDVSDWKVADLKKALKILQMPVSGKKKDLIERLKAALGEGISADEDLYEHD